MSQPLATRRYAFETVFAPDGEILSEGAAAPMYSADDLARERAAGVEEGRRSEVARAEASAAASLVAIAEAVARLTERTTQDRREVLQDASRLALAAARKAAGIALDRFGEERVVAALDAAFDTFIHAPRVVIRLASGQDVIRPKLEACAREHGFTGALVVRAETTLATGDVVLDWGDGALMLSAEDAFRRIEDAVADHLSAGDHA